MTNEIEKSFRYRKIFIRNKKDEDHKSFFT